MDRCGWCGDLDIYVAYHDQEWGVPEWDSRALWEKLVLDGFQAGLSWLTILRKRDAFRAAFHGFDPEKVAAMGDTDVARLLQDPGIVRHRGKIEAAIKGARVWIQIEEKGPGFGSLIWDRVDGAPIQNQYRTAQEVPTQDALSLAISKDLRARGFTFVGPTIVYAWMEACGLMNNHLTSCFRHKIVADFGQG
ncbi:MAG: DNA-3-methyladenine glycosylase I [Pseudomonadota bacterium]